MGKIIGFVQGADVFLIVALLIFMLVFVFATLFMATMSKKYCEELSNLPLEQNNLQKNEK